MSLADVATNRGDVVRLPVTLDAQGDESALGFSLEYDPDLLTYLDLQLLGPATNAQAAPAVQRADREGVVGLALAWPANQVAPAGLHTVAELSFASAAGGQSATTTVVLGDDPMPRGVAGTDAGTLSADFSVAAQVSLLVATACPGRPPRPQAWRPCRSPPTRSTCPGPTWLQTRTAIACCAGRRGRRLDRDLMVLSANASSYEDIGLAASMSTATSWRCSTPRAPA